jgi:DNA-binding ferritin-like protein
MAEDVKQILTEYKDETKRHFDVVAERLEDKIGVLSEQVAANTEKLEEYDQRFNKIDETLEVIKLDIEFIKNELKQKVSREEFVVLEKRVSMLEAKYGK